MGERRIGLAVSDAGGTLATPLGFVNRTALRDDIRRILDRAAEVDAGAIVVGLPMSEDGSVGPQAKRVKAFVKALRAGTDLRVETADERFSTAEAERLLRQAGRQPARHKGEVDAAAAAVILQEYLDRSSRHAKSQAG